MDHQEEAYSENFVMFSDEARRYLSPRPPPKISLRHDLNWTKGNDQSGSTVEHQPVGKLVQHSFGEAPRAESSKSTPSKPNPIGDRTGKPVEASSHKVQEVGSLEHRDDANKFNLSIDDENIDFNISSVPNAMVKRSHGINMHNLIQQIENHPQRHALQSDLQQHQAFNPFSEESKRCDYGCWEHRTMRDSRRGAEITVQSMPNALEHRNCILHMWTPYERLYNRK